MCLFYWKGEGVVGVDRCMQEYKEFAKRGVNVCVSFRLEFPLHNSASHLTCLNIFYIEIYVALDCTYIHQTVFMYLGMFKKRKEFYNIQGWYNHLLKDLILILRLIEIYCMHSLIWWLLKLKEAFALCIFQVRRIFKT